MKLEIENRFSQQVFLEMSKYFFELKEWMLYRLKIFASI